MPSDCQCSTHTEPVVVEKVLNNKQATRKMRRLEEEVEILKYENSSLKQRLRKASINKEKILKELRSKLDRL